MDLDDIFININLKFKKNNSNKLGYFFEYKKRYLVFYIRKLNYFLYYKITFTNSTTRL